MRDLIIDCFAGGGGASVGIGNSVVPIMAEALVRSNCSDLIVGRRAKNLVLDCSENQLKFA